MEGFEAKLNHKSDDLFCSRAQRPQLQVLRQYKTPDETKKTIINFKTEKDIEGLQGVNTVEDKLIDFLQIFLIRQVRSWTTLDISPSFFKTFIRKENLFSNIWPCIFTFGRKSEENEFEFPGFQVCHKLSSNGQFAETFESACVLRRAELHGREVFGHDIPWSIRQTAVYHRFHARLNGAEETSNEPGPTFLLIAPSKDLESKICFQVDGIVSQWSVYNLLVTESLRGWMDYMAYLDSQLKKSSYPAVFMKVDGEKSPSLSSGDLQSLIEFEINFKDRQSLNVLEDRILDLQTIFPTLLDNIRGIQEQFRTYCSNCCTKRQQGPRYGKSNLDEKSNTFQSSHKCLKVEACSCTLGDSSVEKSTQHGRCDCSHNIKIFDGYIKEVEMYIQRAAILRDKAASTAKLLSDLLSYENAVSLKKVARESQKESKSLFQLTEKSTKDAAAVKILTIISLIYLPTTIVSNFFSTQFVHTTESGEMQISANAWLLAAIAIPLTIATLIVWWIWIQFKILKLSEPISRLWRMWWQQIISAFTGIFSEKKEINDPEKAMVSPTSTFYEPSTAIKDTYPEPKAWSEKVSPTTFEDLSQNCPKKEWKYLV